jgi:hypothetical protein
MTYGLTRKHYARLEALYRDKHSNLLGPFISYEENEVLLIFPLDLPTNI